MEKHFGKGAIHLYGASQGQPVAAIPTGSLALDAALGIGGIPRGRITEIFGPESSGKTTLALHILAEAQKLGGVGAFIDVEHALDPDYARRLGVEIDDLLISQPDSGEQALEIAGSLILSNTVDLIVLDSVAALVPKAELDGEIGDAHAGLQARLMSQALRKLTGALNRTATAMNWAATAMIFINQIREKIGVVFGNPETTTGGRALKFYASVRMEVRKGSPIKDGEQTVGNRTKVKVVKNKLSAPFREAEFDILYGQGISRELDLVDVGVEQGFIEKSGSWFSFQGERIGQGRENARQHLVANPRKRQELEALLRERLIPARMSPASESPEAERAQAVGA